MRTTHGRGNQGVCFSPFRQARAPLLLEIAKMADMDAISAALEGHLELPDESLVSGLCSRVPPPPCRLCVSFAAGRGGTRG